MRGKKYVRVAVIASGSSGNAALLQMNGTNVLIDAGISAKRITAGLAAFGLLAENLHGIVITHEHSDHIQGLGVLLKKRKIPVFCRPATGKEIANKFAHLVDCIEDVGENFGIGTIACESFSVNHDAVDPVGFNFYSDRMKVSHCTDIGKMTADVSRKLDECDILTLESNHDPDLLKTGPYPEFLKKRIAGARGHLSNYDAGNALANLRRKQHCVTFLAHLSKENNNPEVAEATVKGVLKEYDICCSNEIQLRMTWPDRIASYEKGF